ncbi:MAG TPA: hypothetical protein VFP33_09450 [Gallionella sp.]|nr:hypothetical protein [Gallionella sp.]
MQVFVYAHRVMFPAALAALLLLGGCANNLKATAHLTNPPPSEAYSNFSRIEVKAATLAPAFSNDGANQKAVERINANLNKRLEGVLPEWNKRPTNGRRLIIEPVVSEIRFIGVGARLFAGPLAGSSSVKVDVKVIDASTGKVIDNPEFYQRSSAGSGFALGVADNMMLVRMGELVGDYIIRNYPKAVGGKTGSTD